jgi:asparagine synthetase B (glutamine-hydrolysing)
MPMESFTEGEALVLRNGKRSFSRDRLGVEPMLYAPFPGGVVVGKTYGEIFATELVPRRWRKEALLDFLSVGTVSFPEGETFFEGVYEVPPGCDLKVSGSQVDVAVRATLPLPLEELGEEALPLLRERIMEALAGPPEEAGLCLSGGLDSTSLAAAWARQGNPRCFIYGMPGSIDRELALETAEALGIEPFLLEPNVGVGLEELREMLRALEIPVHIPGGPLPQFRLLSAMADRGVKTVLSGQGGDELFCGYPWHFPLAMKKLAIRDPKKAENLRALHEKRPPFAPMDLRLSRRQFTRTSSWVTLSDGGACKALGLTREEVAERRGVRSFAANLADWEALRHHGLMARSLRYLLHYDHRLTRHFGLKGRAPFLEDGLVDLVSRFRLDFLYDDGLLKYPLRRLFPEVPERVRFHTRKTGFWHNGPGLPDFRPEVRRLLQHTALGDLIVRPDEVERMSPAALWRFFSAGVLMATRV